MGMKNWREDQSFFVQVSLACSIGVTFSIWPLLAELTCREGNRLFSQF